MQLHAFLPVAVTFILVADSGILRADSSKEPDRIADLIKQLGHDQFARREAAGRELEALGKRALFALRDAAASNDDLEVRRRAERIFQAIAARLTQKAEMIRRNAWRGVHVYHTAFSPDGRLYCAGGDSGTIRLYDVKTGKQLQELVGHGHWMANAVFTPDGKQVLSASMDKTLRLWDLSTGNEVRQFNGHEEGVASVDLTRDGKWSVSGGADNTLRLWEIATGKERRKIDVEGHAHALFTRDGKQVLSHGMDSTMRLWDVASGKELRAFEGHTAEVFGAFALPGGKKVLSYSGDQTARVWNLGTGKEESRLDLGENLGFRGLGVSRDGQHILVGDDGNGKPGVRLIELATGKEVHRFDLPSKPRGLSFSPDGRFAANGSFRGFVYLWRVPGLFE